MGSIRFPNLGFEVLVGKNFTLFNINIAFYGVIIALGMVLGAVLAYREARRTGQIVDHYIDYTIFGIIGAIIGARLYYVAFEWQTLMAGVQGPWATICKMFDIRSGGLAIYGGIIGAVAVLIVYCKIKKLRIAQFLDTIVLGLLVGQIFGRWGNFFNREAFGCFTFNFLDLNVDMSNFAPFKAIMMELLPSDVASGTYTNEMVGPGGYVQVLPTFFLESVGNLIVLIILFVFKDKKKFYGETACRYLIGYGILRFFLEGFRTDQLKVGNVAVSQVLSLLMVVVGLAIIIFKYIELKGKPAQIDPIPTKEEAKAIQEAARAAEEAKKAEKKNRKANKKAEEELEEEIEEFEDEVTDDSEEEPEVIVENAEEPEQAEEAEKPEA